MAPLRLGLTAAGCCFLCAGSSAFTGSADDSAQKAAQRPAERAEKFLGILALLLFIVLVCF